MEHPYAVETAHPRDPQAPCRRCRQAPPSGRATNFYLSRGDYDWYPLPVRWFTHVQDGYFLTNPNVSIDHAHPIIELARPTDFEELFFANEAQRNLWAFMRNPPNG